MQHFLADTDIAEHLGITIHTLNARIADGTFPEPDATIGNDHKGCWHQTTIDAYEASQRPDIYIDLNLLATIINDLRRSTEHLRPWIQVADRHHAKPEGFNPTSTLSIAAERLENYYRSMRSIVSFVGETFTSPNPMPAGECRELTTNLEGPLPIIIVSPHTRADDTGSAMLTHAAVIHDTATRIPHALNNPFGPRMTKQLIALADAVAGYARDVINTPATS